MTVDLRFNARSSGDPAADPRILLVGIGEYSLERAGRWEEWTRKIHAGFLDRLRLKPPAVIAYDFLFTEKSDDPESDEAFGREIEAFPSVVTGAFVDDSRSEAKVYPHDRIGNTRPLTRVEGDRSGLIRGPSGPVPIDRIASASWTGFVNSPPSGVDGVRRRIPLVVEFGGEVYPSFVLQILLQLDGIPPEEVEVVLGEAVTLRGEKAVRRIPIDQNGFMTLNYRRVKSFEPLEYIGVMEWLDEFGRSGSWPSSRPPVEGQILLVGQFAEGLTDFGPTPYAAREPLVLVQAVALNNILQGDHLRIVPFWKILLAWLPLAWLTLFLLRNASVIWSTTVPILLVAAYTMAAFLLFRSHSLQLPLVLPVVGFLLVHAVAVVERLVVEMKAKSRIKNLFGTFAPPEVVEAILASGEDPELGGEQVEITAFFSDIRSFSTFSEQLPPERLVALMNEYLTAMTDELLARGGSLDKYIGDAIVGMFGAPLPMADHARRACAASIQMQRRQAELCAKWRRDGRWPEIVLRMKTRIGLNSGPAVVGHMGSPRRLHYGMMGDTVNLAARCESGAKSYGVFTMVTGETRAGAMAEKDDIAFRYLDKIVVKGRSQAVEIHEVLGFADELSGKTTECLELYAGGMTHYFARQWDAARADFVRSAEREPLRPGEDPEVLTNPSLVMIERCETLKAKPPGDDWDGRFVMTTK